MRRSSGRGSGGGIRQARSAAFRDHDAARAGCQGGANNGSQVLWIFHAVQQHEQSRRRRWATRIQKILERDARFRRKQRDDALVLARTRGAIDLRALFESYGDAIATRQPNDFLEPVTMPASGNQHGSHRSSSGQRLAHGVNTRQFVHV